MLNNIGMITNRRAIDAKSRSYNFFWAGFIIYMIGASFPNFSHISFYFTQAAQVIGLLIFVSASVRLVGWKFDNNYLMLIFYFYCLWSIIIVLRGIQFNYDFLKKLLFDGGSGIFLYLAPCIMLFPRNILFIKKVFLVIVTLSFFFLFYDMMFIRPLIQGTPGTTEATGLVETFCGNLGLACGFILLTFIYHTDGRNIFSLFVLFLTFLLASIRARRALMFMSFTTLFSSYIVYFILKRSRALNVFLSFCFIVLVFIIGSQVYSKTRSGLFALITERFEANTRTNVEQSFYRDMGTTDWIIGRGLSGQYFCPGIDVSGSGFTLYRSVIETGYLQIILKGGILSVLIILLMLIPAVFKGFFYSNNVLTKAAAIWILLFILFSIPSSVHDFSLKYLLVWLSAAICYNSDIRNMTDDEIKCELAK
jgi:hypothetical protein